MKRWLQKLKARRLRRQQRSLERWAQQRAHGKTWFVLQTALNYVAFVILANDVFDYFSYRQAPFSRYLGRTIFYFVTTVIIAGNVWERMEGKYKNARLNHPGASADLGSQAHNQTLSRGA